PSDSVIVVDSLLDWFWLNGRMPTTTEASFQLWWGITHGLKGYLLNYAGDDSLTQHGFVQNDLRTTQNVTGIPENTAPRNSYGATFDTHVAYDQDHTHYSTSDQTIYKDSTTRATFAKVLPVPKNYPSLFGEVQREIRDDLS